MIVLEIFVEILFCVSEALYTTYYAYKIKYDPSSQKAYCPVGETDKECISTIVGINFRYIE